MKYFPLGGIIIDTAVVIRPGYPIDQYRLVTNRPSSDGRAADRKARRNAEAGSSPRYGKGFLSQSQLSAHTRLRCQYSPCAAAIFFKCAHILMYTML